MSKTALLAIIMFVPGFYAALAQDENGTDVARIADELHELRSQAERVILDNTRLYIFSFTLGMVMAGIAIWSTYTYKKSLNAQLDNAKAQFQLAQKAMKNEMRPVLAWITQNNNSMLRVEDQGEDSKIIVIKVSNVGRGPAIDVAARYQVGNADAIDLGDESTQVTGALAPGSSVEIPIFMSGEQHKQQLDGQTMQIKLLIFYTDSENNSYTYSFAGTYSRNQFDMNEYPKVVPDNDDDYTNANDTLSTT